MLSFLLAGWGAGAEAGWSLLEGPSAQSATGMLAPAELLHFPDNRLLLICLDDSGTTPFLQLALYSQDGDLLAQGVSHLPNWRMEGRIHATVLDSNRFAFALNGVSLPDTSEAGFLLRAVDLDFYTLGSAISSFAERDSVVDIQPVTSSLVAVTGISNGAGDRAFVKTMQVDGLWGWTWQDSSNLWQTSCGLSLTQGPDELLFGLMRVDSAFERKALLVGLNTMGVVVHYAFHVESTFPYRSGVLYSHPFVSRVYYGGFDPLEAVPTFRLGMYSLEGQMGWEETRAGSMSGMSLLSPAPSRLLIVSDGPEMGWSEVDSISVSNPSEHPQPLGLIETGGVRALTAGSNSFLLLGQSISRFGTSGALYYSEEAGFDVLGGERLTDTTFAVLYSEEIASGRYRHSIQWYTEHFINEPPELPEPLMPEDGAVLDLETQPSAAITWRRPTDPDPESHPLADLILRVQRFQRPDTLFTVAGLTDSSFSMERLADVSDVHLDGLRGAIWSLRITSQGDTTRMELPWSFSLIPSAIGEQAPLPELFALQAYPNPFNSTLQITFTLPEPASVELRLLNILGQTVFRQVLNSLPHGEHQRTIHPTCSSGTYLLQLIGGNGSELSSRRITLLK